MYTKDEIFEQHIEYLRRDCKEFFVKAYPEENDKDTFRYVFIIKLGKPTLDKSHKSDGIICDCGHRMSAHILLGYCTICKKECDNEE